MTTAPDTSSTATPAPVKLVTVTIDGVEVSVPKDTLVIRAAEEIGVMIPRFCDHPLLDPVGACRQCLVEVPDAGNGRGMPKPQASCTLPVAEGMVVHTQNTSPVAEKAQEGILEFLLVNHPLDCPICDKGGECPLQNQALSNGAAESRFEGNKRLFPKPINISAQILLDRERCVLCARCTRFSEQIAGDPFIALIERGALQQVGIYEREPFQSYFSGNTIQICPVGALTSSAYRFRSRPFDLVSSPSISELDACGAAIRVDHRRGKVMRRLSGDAPEVNEEWISDKDRFAFTYDRADDRLRYPMVRDEETGQLRVASWPEALAVAARGLAAAGAVGVLPGGRVTTEDAYAYAKFARVALGTNDIDFRARPLSGEETDFLAAEVAGAEMVTYADLESAGCVVLIGLEPEDEAATIFLRLRKAFRKKCTRVFSVGSFTSRGLRKMGGTLVPARPGEEANVVRGLANDGAIALDAGGVILVGERMATVPGALSAAADLARTTGAKLAWVPRRPGDRGALEAGAFPTLLPGGRPVADPAARVDLAAAWGLAGLPEVAGRDADAIWAAAAAGELKGLVVGGVDPVDAADPSTVRRGLLKADFVVSLELRASEVTEIADVVFPVATVADKSGTFINWEGRARSFERIFEIGGVLPDVRVLAGIADELGRPLGFKTVPQARAEMAQLGAWDGVRPVPAAADVVAVADDAPLVLASWKQLIDDGRMQVGSPDYLATARAPIAAVSPATLAAANLVEGETITLSGPRGSVQLPVVVAEDMVDGVVWAPASAPGVPVRQLVGEAGSSVRIEGGQA